MLWRFALDQFHTDALGKAASMPKPQVLPLPATMARPIGHHLARTWVRFFAGFAREAGKAREGDR